MLPNASARENAEQTAGRPVADVDDLVFEGQIGSFDAELAWEWDRTEARDV